MKTVEIPFPAKRCRCAICGASLLNANQFQDMNICTTEGIILTVCSQHAEAGDQMLMKFHTILRTEPPKMN